MAVLEAQHLVDEDRPVEVGFREAVGLRAQLLVHLALGEAERIEIGGEVAHHAIGADQHQGADAVLGGAQGRRRRQLEADGLARACSFSRTVLLSLAVIAGERPEQLAIAAVRSRSSGRAHDGPGCSPLPPAGCSSWRLGEEMPPFVADRAGVALVVRLHLLDVGGIRTMEEGGPSEGFVLGLSVMSDRRPVEL